MPRCPTSYHFKYEKRKHFGNSLLISKVLQLELSSFYKNKTEAEDTGPTAMIEDAPFPFAPLTKNRVDLEPPAVPHSNAVFFGGEGVLYFGRHRYFLRGSCLVELVGHAPPT